MSRNHPHSKRLHRRPGRSLAASLVAIVLLAIGVAAIWFSVARLVNGSWPGFLATAVQWFGSLSWDSPGIWIIAITAVGIGLVLLLAALIPGRFSGMQVQAGGDDDRATEALLSNRALTRLATAHAERMDGVITGKARVKGKKVRLTVTSPLRQPGDLRRRVAESVAERLQSTGLVHKPKVGVRVRSISD